MIFNLRQQPFFIISEADETEVTGHISAHHIVEPVGEMRRVALAPLHTDHGLGHRSCLIRFTARRHHQNRATAVSYIF
ncbi:MAG: hypothetical protein ACE37M_01135 [Henriciella sp.]